MKASEIPALIKQFGRRGSPYRCMLLDGAWGIGKSYQTNKVISERSGTIRISLFGVMNTDEAMSKLCVEILSRPIGVAMKAKEVLANAGLGKLSEIADAFSGLVSARTIVQKALEGLDKKQKDSTDAILIIFDDLERIGAGFDLECFLGALEALLDACSALKILLIANLDALADKHRPVFERYTEKIVERTYRVTELADTIEIFRTSEENVFAMAFMEKHGSQNLRTLLKADNFFQDVKIRIDDLQMEMTAARSFMESVRLTCYAITFEATEALYKTRYQKRLEELEKKSDESKIYMQILYQNIVKDFHRCIEEYTSLDAIAGALVKGLAAYYDNGTFPNDVLEDAFSKYTGTQEKAKLLQSQDEIKESLQRQAKRVQHDDYASFPHFIMDADELLYWGEELDIDHLEWHDMISHRLKREYETFCVKQRQEFSLNILFCDHVRSKEMKALLTDLDGQSQKIKLRLIVAEIEDLLNHSKYQQVADAMICLLRETDKKPDSESQEILLKLITKDEFCPVGSITETQYQFCQTAHMIAFSPFMKDAIPAYEEAIQRWTERHKTDKMLTLRFQHFSR